MGGFLHTKGSPSFPPPPPVIDEMVITMMMMILMMMILMMMMTTMTNVRVIITSSDSAKEIDLESDLGKKTNAMFFVFCFFLRIRFEHKPKCPPSVVGIMRSIMRALGEEII